MSGTELIAAERQRQIEKEGWSLEHDDKHSSGELARAGICYAMWNIIEHSKIVRARETIQLWWPWDWEWWKPKDEISNLVRAGALIAAEIDRLERSTVANKAFTRQGRA